MLVLKKYCCVGYALLSLGVYGGTIFHHKGTMARRLTKNFL